MSARSRVLSSYRRLFRARSRVFQGDDHALHQAKLAIRSEMAKTSSITSEEHLQGLLLTMDEAAHMLTHGIVQGKENEKGNYQVKVPSSAEDQTLYKPVTQETVEQLEKETAGVQIDTSCSSNANKGN